MNKNPRINPIETLYSGIRFRSRLEARWAVFFDALKIQWEYEPEAYALPSGNYLPDFRLTLDSGVYWVEVRPFAEDKADPRWLELVGVSGQSLLLLTQMAQRNAGRGHWAPQGAGLHDLHSPGEHYRVAEFDTLHDTGDVILSLTHSLDLRRKNTDPITHANNYAKGYRFWG